MDLEIGSIQVRSWDIYCIFGVVSHTFCTSAGVVAGCASLASRSCPETVDAGLSTGLTASSVCFLESGCACTSSFGATAGSLAVASAFF